MRESIDFASLSPETCQETLSAYRISLTVDEILKIQNEILKRPPSLTECILWSIQGSEHCSYKSSRSHLKQFVTDAPNVILGPSEDAGIVEVARDLEGNKYGIVMSHESHNHPSQIVPYEGAATGIGGNVRDVSCMGAKVIANADPLRFGDISAPKTRWIQDGVVAGIAGYGNPIGVPTIAGDIYFDKSYNGNCLVNVVTLGTVRADEVIHSRAPQDSDGYDLILVGKATDNSGFGGASFASGELDVLQQEVHKGAVQEPNAFLKRHLLKALYTLLPILKNQGLLPYVGLKDLGAGGIACASVEIADSAGYGAEINLDLVPVSMRELHPSVILCSETQERYLWAVRADITPLILTHYNVTFDLPSMALGAQAAVIGKVKDHGEYIVRYRGEAIVQAKASDITQGLRYDRVAKAPQAPHEEPTDAALGIPTETKRYLDWCADSYCKILAHENIASREPIYERYDKQVQGQTIIEPGEADAGVIRPFLDEFYPSEIRNCGVALSVDQNPRYGMIDPYRAGVLAVLESARNVAAVGAYPAAFTDCLNFGNPEKPEQMWEFVEAVRGVADAAKGLRLKEYPDSPVPIISGNVSLYNESEGASIAPSPIIACLGVLKDSSHAIKMSFVKADSALYLIGMRLNECGGSVFYSLFGALGATLPSSDVAEANKQIHALTDAITSGLVRSAHDISDGGIAVTLAEMSFYREIGCVIEITDDLPLHQYLFSETPGFVIEADPTNDGIIREHFSRHDVPIYPIGKTQASKNLTISKMIDQRTHEIICIDLVKAKQLWQNGLREK
ncbi:phosphoribosylformylglycinamidine synthase subunit PurL [Candidatus Uhrbacteria bacterium]|nr:phosphoribosylformylglycinamidine synthase subunit PurL [Candidatus Uhrbacteria bacterium]